VRVAIKSNTGPITHEQEVTTLLEVPRLARANIHRDA